MPPTEEEVLEIDPQAEHNGEPVETEKPVEPKLPKPDEAVKQMTRALKETREAMRQANESAKFWMEQARGFKKPEAAEEAEPALSVDLVAAITDGDTKAIAKAMRELGFVSKNDVASTINSTRREVTAEQKLIGQYPDLDDEKSEHFRLTAQIYNELAQDPDMARSKALTATAARMAAKELGIDGGTPRRSSRRSEPDDEDEDVDRDDEQNRVERVARQSGDRGRRSSSTGGRENSDELDPMQKSIVAKLKAAGADISEEAYRKRAKAGVRMAGLPTRRPRY